MFAGCQIVSAGSRMGYGLHGIYWAYRVKSICTITRIWVHGTSFADGLSGRRRSGRVPQSEKINGTHLVLKRDNGRNMNHSAINDVLAESFVLSLNNPAYYAPYNGAIEESATKGEKTVCGRSSWRTTQIARGSLSAPYVETVVNDLNHQIHLKGRHPVRCSSMLATDLRLRNGKEGNI